MVGDQEEGFLAAEESLEAETAVLGENEGCIRDLRRGIIGSGLACSQTTVRHAGPAKEIETLPVTLSLLVFLLGRWMGEIGRKNATYHECSGEQPGGILPVKDVWTKPAGITTSAIETGNRLSVGVSASQA